MIDKKHIGSSFDSFIEEENILQESETVAIKRVIAYALEQKMLADNISVTYIVKSVLYNLLYRLELFSNGVNYHEIFSLKFQKDKNYLYYAN